MGKVFVFDHAKCNGCRNCQIACKDEHVDNDWSPWAKPQPDTGHFWTHIEERVCGQVPKVKVSYLLHICQHCENAPCIEAAPEAVFRRDDGLVIIDPEKAKGLKELVEACPYEAIFWNEELELPQKCTGCAHLVDAGEVPHCVDVCPHGALRFGDEEDFESELAIAEALVPERAKTDCPRVHYLNLPKRFLAGLVVDLEADEVVIGAKVTAENVDSGEVLVTETDEFGDFWFHCVPEANWKLYVEAEGYLSRMLEASTVEEDRNVGPVQVFAS
ncbi:MULTISPECIES: 4Fe-4S dicluster domain-containing protein [Gordonibacter]|uniref:Carboxypeptidase regulatory-like domain-containing protein n=1 Tax=Gordonibacter faecis TaxID=3047475 RepID=A0ABT7DJL3_9ACTN|nr:MULTISPECIES: 4Fe-4S dicluster domain-containing protein [unclassified Gordonibacter]MDJ1649708.1 carboxypeptidase regulatory-like domain-containing protein [Gordonibacter sp. KGMB12511]HIW76511.1 carboxypeptidase regulatory-like domain-containing protein [Candidatus Gordonibacter avicola]